MQVLEVRDLMLRHKDVVLDVNIGKLQDALERLIGVIGPEGENLAFLARDNTFTREQHITIADSSGEVINSLTIQPDLIYSNRAIYFDTAGLKRNPLPDSPEQNEIVTWKEVTDLRNELHDRTEYATETTTGVVRLATQAEADAFEDDKAVITPKKLSHLNDRVQTLERKRVYYIEEALPETLLDNTFYVIVDDEEWIYCGFNGVEGEPSFQSVYIARNSTWAQIKEKVKTPFKAGATFVHWLIDGKPVTDDYVFSDESLVAYAVFADAVNILSFVAYEGTPRTQEITVPEGATWKDVKDQVAVPVRTGYGFKEWQINGAALTDEFIFTNPGVFTAVWDSSTIPVVFDGMGGLPRTQQLYVSKGARWDIIKKQITNPTKDKTLFLRWTIDGVSRIPETHQFNDETRVHALYGPPITINIDVGNGLPEQVPVAVAKGSSWYEIKRKFIKPFYDGWTFVCWTLNGYEITDDTFFFQDCTIVATYLEKLEIQFLGDHGTPELQRLSVDQFSTWSFNKPRIMQANLDGHVFAGWVQKKQVFLDVTFDGYNGQPEHQLLVIRRFTTWKEFKDTVQVPLKEHYTFKEWCFANTLEPIDSDYHIEDDQFFRATYTYTLNVDSPEVITVDEDTRWKDIIDLIPIPTLENHSFIKWQIANEDIDPERIIKPTDRIEPFFGRDELVVTLDPAGGESQKTVTVGKGLTWADEKSKFNDATKQYHTFVGWSLDGINPIQDDYIFNGPVTVIALYTRNRITLTFNAKMSTPLTQELEVDEGSTWKENSIHIQDPVQQGLYFMYWIGEHGEVNGDYLFEYSQTLNAYFRLAITLDFDGDHGDPIAQEVITYQGANFKEVKRHLVKPVIADRHFLGWGEKSLNCVYPVFNSPIGEPATQSIEVLKNKTFGDIKAKVQIPKKEYYTFYNWLTPDNTVLSDEYVHEKTEVFTANITRNRTTLIIDTGTNKYEITVNEGSAWGEIKGLIQEPTLEDYTFTHWALGNKMLVDGDIITGETAEINACFTLSEPSIIIINPNGTSSRFDFKFGQTWSDIADIVPVPQKEFFTFDHWEMLDAAIEPTYELKPGDVIVPIYNRTIITIPLDLSGGLSSQGEVQVGQGLTWSDEKSKFESPTKVYFTFKYWMTNGYEVRDSYRFVNPSTFLAIYERNKISLSVMSDGKLFKTIEIDEGSTWSEIKTRLSTPSKLDYKFTHWSLTENGAEITDKTVFESDSTVFAVFAYNVCNLYFNTQEGAPAIPSFKVIKGTTFGEAKKRIPDISKYGYLFAGWSLTESGDIISDDAIMTDDMIELFAIWNNIIYITFDVENGGVQTQVVATTVNTKLSELVPKVITPTKEDYAFIGWAQNPGGLPIEDMIFTGNTTLYAVFGYDVCVIELNIGNGEIDL